MPLNGLASLVVAGQHGRMNILKKLPWRAPPAAPLSVSAADIRPLAPVATFAPMPITEAMSTPAYTSALSYFAAYPPRSVMSDHSRAVLYTLIRTMRPATVAEVGTMYAGTTEVMARALWENGQGIIYTTDPLGGER
jgi:hypothetical protein